MPLGGGGGLSSNRKTTDRDISLRYGINPTISRRQRRDQQGTTTKALRVPHAGDRDINSLTGTRKCRQLRRHHHRRHIFGFHSADLGSNIDPEPLQHRCNAVDGER